jgi:SpoVK/Ycf46/Vps4 family AAA+-type ATPase
MKERDPREELKLLVRSRYGIIVIETPEEDRIETLTRHLADQIGIPLFVWTRTRGLRRDAEEQPIYGTQPTAGALAHVATSRLDAIYHFRGIGPDLENLSIAEQLRELGRHFSSREGVILITGAVVDLPGSLHALAAVMELPPPNLEEYRVLLGQILRDTAARSQIDLSISKADLQRLLKNLKGLTLMEAEKVLTKALVVDGALTAGDIRGVIDAKKEIVERDGLLEYYPVEATMRDIADLHGLKSWLAKRRKLIEKPEEARAFGLTFPRGVLLAGIPGTGKSLCAKAVAMEWGLPLLKMDPAALYNKYVGETERNFKRAMETAEKMAPVVLWIDEIEKAFSTSGSDQDGGVSTRVLGTFLGWLQDRKGDVFVVATANDVSRLPPELVRKGRFDEIFFVDLPDPEARKMLFQIHMSRRGKDPALFDLDALAGETEGFSGADVEQVIVAAMYSSFAESNLLSTEALRKEIAATRPLSRAMPERIHALRAWASERTVRAN